MTRSEHSGPTSSPAASKGRRLLTSLQGKHRGRAVADLQKAGRGMEAAARSWVIWTAADNHNGLLVYRTADTQGIAIDRCSQSRIHVFINEQAVSGPHAGFDASSVIGKEQGVGGGWSRDT